MKYKLYVKFTIAYVIFGILGFLIISTIGSRIIKERLLDEKSRRLYQEAVNVANNQGESYYAKKYTLNEFYTNLAALANYQNTQIWLVSTDGTVLLNTSNKFNQLDQFTLKDFNPAKNHKTYYQVGKFYQQFPENVLSVMVPITNNMTTRGYIAIHYFMSELNLLRDNILGSIYLLYFMIFTISLIILGLFSLSVYLPLKKIIEGAEAYASGNLTHHITIQSEDEMGYLASCLNYMSDELSKTGESQRTFIANVSHDFRSPLTSIKGYAEAMLDGTIPVEMQEKYLTIITYETERLNKLTKGLLTLNDMDGKGRLLDLSVFDINAIIKSTATTFEGLCRSKKIMLQVTFSEANIDVLADVGKIQQVLYNLIDNAIKFSHNDSVIYIETTRKHGKVFVSVKDTGVGIPRNSIPKVWDRFYKGDTSRGKDRKGTGLGLAIVKEIIKSHNQNIDVISTEGVGTEFIFTLDVPKKEGALSSK